MTNDERLAILLKMLDDEKRITPEQIVAAAKNPKHPLHGEFEWRDDVAAHKFRVQQARQMLRSVKLNVQVGERTLRVVAFAHDPSVPLAQQGYRMVTAISQDRLDARTATLAEFTRALAILKRARDIATVLGYGEEIDALIQQAVALSERIGEVQQEAAAAQ